MYKVVLLNAFFQLDKKYYLLRLLSRSCLLFTVKTNKPYNTNALHMCIYLSFQVDFYFMILETQFGERNKRFAHIAHLV